MAYHALSSSLAARELIADLISDLSRQVRDISTCRDSSNLVADWFAAGLRPVR